eukprot:Trichotokara_eunicae@DN4369_c0_g1_i3.p1
MWFEGWDSLCMTIFTAAFGWFVFSVFAYHFYLVCVNQTTNENLKGSFKDGKPNPWNRGCIRNFKEMIFSKRAPRQFNPLFLQFQSVHDGRETHEPSAIEQRCSGLFDSSAPSLNIMTGICVVPPIDEDDKEDEQQNVIQQHV